MVPHHPIPNMIVKRDSGEDTWGVAPWENSTVPKFLKNKFIYKILFLTTYKYL
jgi:hypothetical protein